MSQKHVLLVDDDKNMLSSLEFILETNDFKVTTAIDGHTAMSLIFDSIKNKNPFDVLITDLQMPNLTGIELLNEINRNNVKIPQVAIYATGNTFFNKELQQINQMEYLEKPFNDDELIKRI